MQIAPSRRGWIKGRRTSLFPAMRQTAHVRARNPDVFSEVVDLLLETGAQFELHVLLVSHLD
jgi:hypothetical protein